jgi:hypothetical protein
VAVTTQARGGCGGLGRTEVDGVSHTDTDTTDTDTAAAVMLREQKEERDWDARVRSLKIVIHPSICVCVYVCMYVCMFVGAKTSGRLLCVSIELVAIPLAHICL